MFRQLSREGKLVFTAVLYGIVAAAPKCSWGLCKFARLETRPSGGFALGDS